MPGYLFFAFRGIGSKTGLYHIFWFRLREDILSRLLKNRRNKTRFFRQCSPNGYYWGWSASCSYPLMLDWWFWPDKWWLFQSVWPFCWFCWVLGRKSGTEIWCWEDISWKVSAIPSYWFHILSWLQDRRQSIVESSFGFPFYCFKALPFVHSLYQLSFQRKLKSLHPIMSLALLQSRFRRFRERIY